MFLGCKLYCSLSLVRKNLPLKSVWAAKALPQDPRGMCRVGDDIPFVCTRPKMIIYYINHWIIVPYSYNYINVGLICLVLSSGMWIDDEDGLKINRLNNDIYPRKEETLGRSCSTCMKWCLELTMPSTLPFIFYLNRITCIRIQELAS